MLRIIITLTVLALIVWWLFKPVKDKEPKEDKFPPLEETIVTPEKEVVPQGKLYFNLNGEPYEVFTSESGAKYILRKRVRDGSTYKVYLNASNREKCYYDGKRLL